MGYVYKDSFKSDFKVDFVVFYEFGENIIYFPSSFSSSSRGDFLREFFGVMSYFSYVFFNYFSDFAYNY